MAKDIRGTVEDGAQFGGQGVILFNADGSVRAQGVLRHIEIVPGEGAYNRHVAIEMRGRGLMKFWARPKDRLEPSARIAPLVGEE